MQLDTISGHHSLNIVEYEPPILFSTGTIKHTKSCELQFTYGGHHEMGNTCSGVSEGGE